MTWTQKKHEALDLSGKERKKNPSQSTPFQIKFKNLPFVQVIASDFSKIYRKYAYIYIYTYTYVYVYMCVYIYINLSRYTKTTTNLPQNRRLSPYLVVGSNGLWQCRPGRFLVGKIHFFHDLGVEPKYGFLPPKSSHLGKLL